MNRLKNAPMQKSVVPRTIKGIDPRLAAGSINCGKNAMKKSAAWGLRRFVINPSKYTSLSLSAARPCRAEKSTDFHLRHFITPR